MDIESFRKAGYAAIDSICEYYSTLSQKPVNAQVEPNFLRKAVPDAAPEEPEAWDDIAQDYQKIILPGITHWQHPSFFAYFPGNTSFEGVLADLHTAAISNPGFNWSCSPSVTELEIIVCDWMAKMLGLSSDFLSTSASGIGGGIILGSASEVAITVAIAARERALSQIENQQQRQNFVKSASVQNGRSHIVHDHLELDPDGVASTAEGDNSRKAAQQGKENTVDAMRDVTMWRGEATSRLVLYGTTQTHSIAAKAALILGLSFKALEVHAKDAYALRGETLQEALEEDTRAGRVPFMLIASIGTTSSGAVDNLSEIALVAKSFPSLWIHVDAAYAGVALALPEVRQDVHLAALNECVHSFSTNMHKWGLVQFDCSPLYVKDRGALTRALTVTPEFLRTKDGDAGSVLDLRNMQLSLGRRFRSLKVWFVLRSYGLKGFRAHLRRSIDLAKHFVNFVKAGEIPLRIVTPPRWALVVFRIEPENKISNGNHDLDDLNHRFWNEILMCSKDIALTQTVLPEVGFCIRWVTGSPWTKVEDVEKSYKIICECAEKALHSSAA